MKTQINSLRSGSKNQILNPAIDYTKLPQATSHVGHAGDNLSNVGDVWEKVKVENPVMMTIEIYGQILYLNANWSVSKKSVTYFTTITNDFLENNFPIKSSKTKTAFFSISFGTTIEVSNGKNDRMTICPSLIKIL